MVSTLEISLKLWNGYNYLRFLTKESKCDDSPNDVGDIFLNSVDDFLPEIFVKCVIRNLMLFLIKYYRNFNTEITETCNMALKPVCVSSNCQTTNKCKQICLSEIWHILTMSTPREFFGKLKFFKKSSFHRRISS